MSTVLFLCTGNAARSVIAGVALRQHRPDLRVETAGTLVVDGLPISWRTRAALDAVGLPWPNHASRQCRSVDLDEAALVVAMSREHAAWVRRMCPAAAPYTGTLVALADRLRPPPGLLAERVASLDLANASLDGCDDVTDPGGGDVDAFVACARQVVSLIESLAPRL